METAIWVAVIGMVASILTTVITVTSGNNKTRSEIRTHLAVQDERQQNITDKIEDLTTTVKAHNEFGRKIPVIEEQISNLSHRVDKLERRDAS